MAIEMHWVGVIVFIPKGSSMFKKIAFLCVFALLASVSSARANTIGPTSCSSCDGSSYTLDYVPVSGNTIDVFLTINSNSFSAGTGDYLNAVSLKIVPQSSDITSINLVSSPSSFSTTQSGGISAGGCNGNGNGFFCSESSLSTGVAVGPGHIYTFEWAVTLSSLGDLLTSNGDASVKALYVNSLGNKVGAITSEDITLSRSTTPPVPEPSSLALLGTGIISAAGFLRRRLMA